MNDWAKTRQKGYKRYIGIRLILSIIFGLLGGLFTTWLSYVTWNNDAFNSIKVNTVAAVIGTTIGALIASNSSWKSNEKKYLKNVNIK